MKKMRKIFALLIAMVMTLGMSLNASAASITITHDESFETNGDSTSTPRVYNVFKIFDASYEELAGENTQEDKDDFTYEPEDAAVSYSMDAENPWVDVMKLDEQSWFDVKEDANGNYVVTPKENAYETASDAANFAAFLLENMPADLDPDTTVTVDAAAVTVDPGYYLVVAKDDKDAVTRLALVTTDVEMVEKNTYIGSDKTTEETSYTVGETISYTATVTIPEDTALTIPEGEGYKSGHGPIILHDTMDPVLAFDEDSVASTTVTDFEVVTDPEDDCTFEIVFPVTEELLGQTVTFTYSAVLTSAAVNPDTGFINELFAENNGYKTVPATPQVYTFDFNFEKTFVGSEDETLKATFQLEDADGNVFNLKKLSDGKYVVCGEDEEGATTEIESANNAAIQVVGLKAGTYKLVELSTSAGYNLLDAPATVVITDTSVKDDNGKITSISHTVTIDGASSTAENPALIENQAGTVLPSTGGIGTTMFYVIGAVLVLGAGIVMVSKRRMDA